MRLSKQHIAKYQAIYYETFGQNIDNEEAMVQGMALLRLVKVLATTNNNENNNEQLSPKAYRQVFSK